jgi:hypothetical protein
LASPGVAVGVVLTGSGVRTMAGGVSVGGMEVLASGGVGEAGGTPWVGVALGGGGAVGDGITITRVVVGLIPGPWGGVVGFRPGPAGVGMAACLGGLSPRTARGPGTRATRMSKIPRMIPVTRNAAVVRR